MYCNNEIPQRGTLLPKVREFLKNRHCYRGIAPRNVCGWILTRLKDKKFGRVKLKNSELDDIGELVLLKRSQEGKFEKVNTAKLNKMIQQRYKDKVDFNVYCGYRNA